MKQLFSFRQINQNRQQYCILCHDSAESVGLCAGCFADVAGLATVEKAVCPYCASPSYGGVVCGRCQQRRPAFEYLWASFYYETPVSGMVYALKHQANIALAAPLAAMMTQNAPPWLATAQIDAVLPVPLHPKRRVERGFNQSELLAEYLAKYYGWCILPPRTVFRRPRPPQSTLERKQRLQNVRHAFDIRHPHEVKNCNLLLIDDVTTTGATLYELAQTLKQSGANAVFAWTTAHPRMKKF